jgi:hypothetical protein
LAAEPAKQSGAQVSLLPYTCLSLSSLLSSGIYSGCWQHPHEFVKMFPFRIHRTTQNRGGGEKKLTLNNFDDGSKKNLAGKDFPLKNQEKHGSAIQKL